MLPAGRVMQCSLCDIHIKEEMIPEPGCRLAFSAFGVEVELVRQINKGFWQVK